MSTKLTLTPHQSNLYSHIENILDAQKNILKELNLKSKNNTAKSAPAELKSILAKSIGHHPMPSDLSYAAIAYSLENYPSVPSSQVLKDMMLDQPGYTNAKYINPDLCALWYNIANTSLRRIHTALNSVCDSIDANNSSQVPALKPEKVSKLMEDVILPDLSSVIKLVTSFAKIIEINEGAAERDKKNFSDTAKETLNLLPTQQLLDFIKQLSPIMNQVDKIYTYTLTGTKKNNELLDSEIKDIISEGTTISVLLGYIDKYENGGIVKDEYFKEVTQSLLDFTLSFNTVIKNSYYEEIDVKTQVMVNYFNLNYLDIIKYKNEPKVAKAIKDWISFMLSRPNDYYSNKTHPKEDWVSALLSRPNDYYSNKTRPKFFDAIPNMSARALGYFLSELDLAPGGKSYTNRDDEKIKIAFDKKTKKEDLVKIKWPRLACLEGITHVDLSAYNSTNKVIDFIASLLKADFEQGRTFCSFFDQEIKTYLLKNKATLHQDVLVSILKYSQAQKSKYKTLEAVCDDFGEQITKIEKEYMEKEIQKLTPAASEVKTSTSAAPQSAKKFKI